MWLTLPVIQCVCSLMISFSYIFLRKKEVDSTTGSSKETRAC